MYTHTLCVCVCVKRMVLVYSLRDMNRSDSGACVCVCVPVLIYSYHVFCLDIFFLILMKNCFVSIQSALGTSTSRTLHCLITDRSARAPVVYYTMTICANKSMMFKLNNFFKSVRELQKSKDNILSSLLNVMCTHTHNMLL